MPAPHAAGSGQPLNRRPAVVAFLDVAGYSRLMGVDDEGTLRRWVALQRGVIEPCIASHGGRIVDRAGDGLFMEFRAAGETLNWAVNLQAAVTEAALAVPPMRLRVALHAGEVIDGPDGGLHGDGVNIMRSAPTPAASSASRWRARLCSVVDTRV